jgi:hypothetical protein
MSDSEKPFTVSDRRHFTPDGQVRENAEKESPEPVEEATPRAEEGEPEAPPSPGSETEPVDFGQFLLSLGAQAGMLLSGQGLPEGADAKEALAGAQSIISILEMLQEKTRGNRTPREDEVLEGLLFELRMAYVEKSRTDGS